MLSLGGTPNNIIYNSRIIRVRLICLLRKIKMPLLGLYTATKTKLLTIDKNYHC
jgi:hypothetical protein